MDTFFEQIIKIKKTGATYLAYLLITLLAMVLIMLAVMFVPSIAIIVAALAVYGAFKLYSMFNIEYEYIITNSCFDIDKIIAKNSRKRISTFDLSSVVRIEKYNRINKHTKQECFIACNGTEDNAILLTVQPEGKAKRSIVIAPDERLYEAMKKFLPKYIVESI